MHGASIDVKSEVERRSKAKGHSNSHLAGYINGRTEHAALFARQSVGGCATRRLIGVESEQM